MYRPYLMPGDSTEIRVSQRFCHTHRGFRSRTQDAVRQIHAKRAMVQTNPHRPKFLNLAYSEVMDGEHRRAAARTRRWRAFAPIEEERDNMPRNPKLSLLPGAATIGDSAMLQKSAMRTAFVHYWLLGMRGGEKVLEALCRILPDADLFTLFYDPESVSPTIRSRRISASYLNPLRRFHRSLLPLMPSALESFDLRGYDLVISSESGPAKGVLTPARTRHICYCHTPMRYLWELYPAYLNQWTTSSLKRMCMRPFARNLRLWDFVSAQRVDEFIANSENVRRRIWKTYRRESVVIHPPVAVESFFHRPAGDYFLIVSELVAYKQLDYAVRLFARLGRKLKIAGDGPEYGSLKRQAGPSVEFCGRVPDIELRELYAHSRAFLLPGEEDFGIATVEALASGKPVIAVGRGGALETVPPSGGILYSEASEADLERALIDFEALEASVQPQALQQWTAKFSEARFQENIERIISVPVRPQPESH
jgi:glycosyltransferase involved in cell wall biosynthesis